MAKIVGHGAWEWLIDHMLKSPFAIAGWPGMKGINRGVLNRSDAVKLGIMNFLQTYVKNDYKFWADDATLEEKGKVVDFLTTFKYHLEAFSKTKIEFPTRMQGVIDKVIADRRYAKKRPGMHTVPAA